MQSLGKFVNESIIAEGKWSSYYDDDEPEGKLAAYIYDANVGYIDPDTLKYLLRGYPNTKKVLAYRGLHFSTREDYKKFLDSIENNRLDLSGYSSWTRSKSTAVQFALTKPTNNIMFLGQEFFRAESERRKAKDYTQGFGVILEIAMKPGMGVDVNSIPHIGQENEIILQSGTYLIKVVKHFQPHKSGIKDIPDLNKYIQSQRRISSGKGQMMEFSMLQFILANYEDELTDKSRKHLFNMFRGGLNLNDLIWAFDIKGTNYFDLPILKIDVDRAQYRYGRENTVIKKEDLLNNKDQMNVTIDLHNFNYNLLGYFEMFLEEDKDEIRKVVSELGDQLVDKLNLTLDDTTVDYFFNLQVPGQIFELIDPSVQGKIKRMLNHNVGTYYNKINSREEINKINKLSGQEQQQAIQNQIKDLENLFKKFN